MKVIKKTKEYVIYQKASGRYAVKDADKKQKDTIKTEVQKAKDEARRHGKELSMADERRLVRHLTQQAQQSGMGNVPTTPKPGALAGLGKTPSNSRNNMEPSTPCSTRTPISAGAGKLTDYGLP